MHLAWIGVRYRTMLYCVNTIQATALFPSIWPELSVLSGCPNLRRHHLQPRTFLDYEMPVPLMAIQRRRGELNKRALNAYLAAICANNAELLPAILERLFNQGGREP